MNIDNINKLITFLKSLPEENFDHGRWAESGFAPSEIPGVGLCGTTACIAGWATFLSNPEEWDTTAVNGVNFIIVGDGKYEDAANMSVDARNWLELEGKEADIIFVPFIIGNYSITRILHEEGVTGDVEEICDRLSIWDGATRSQAIEFLERCVRENAVKLSWWVEMFAPELLEPTGINA